MQITPLITRSAAKSAEIEVEVGGLLKHKAASKIGKKRGLIERGVRADLLWLGVQRFMGGKPRAGGAPVVRIAWQ